MHDSMNIPKNNLLLIFTFYFKYLKYIFFNNLGIKTALYLIFNCNSKAEKRNSQREHGQLMEQTRGLFCTCNSGVARYQSQHQC